MEIIDEHTAQLGFTAGIHFTGPLDPGPDEALAHDILAVTAKPCPTAHATPTPPPSPSPWCSRTG